MKIKQLWLILFFMLITIPIISAQENKVVVLNLKNGYSVKGEIIEQTSESLKIKTLDGEVFEYNIDEIKSTSVVKTSSTSQHIISSLEKIVSPTKIIPLAITKGDQLVNIGIGFFGQPSVHFSDGLIIPPIPIAYEYVITDDLFNGNGAFGVGGYLGFTARKYYDDDVYSKLIVGVRGFVHYAIIEKLDTYTGLLLGIKSEGISNKYIDPTLNIFAGARYFYSDKMAVMAELGWGISIITIGVTVKF